MFVTETDEGFLGMSSNATLDVIPSRDIKVAGLLGPAARVEKKSPHAAEAEVRRVAKIGTISGARVHIRRPPGTVSTLECESRRWRRVWALLLRRAIRVVPAGVRPQECLCWVTQAAYVCVCVCACVCVRHHRLG